mmetsp:Transcript_109422/g.340943  ORF Transcript_109422/g.340943 Transcript_109422/m.340943 type:complete len:341 (-) Transcript_109422:407-1429(-)
MLRVCCMKHTIAERLRAHGHRFRQPVSRQAVPQPLRGRGHGLDLQGAEAPRPQPSGGPKQAIAQEAAHLCHPHNLARPVLGRRQHQADEGHWTVELLGVPDLVGDDVTVRQDRHLQPLHVGLHRGTLHRLDLHVNAQREGELVHEVPNEVCRRTMRWQRLLDGHPCLDGRPELFEGHVEEIPILVAQVPSPVCCSQHARDPQQRILGGLQLLGERGGQAGVAVPVEGHQQCGVHALAGHDGPAAAGRRLKVDRGANVHAKAVPPQVPRERCLAHHAQGAGVGVSPLQYCLPRVDQEHPLQRQVGHALAESSGGRADEGGVGEELGDPMEEQAEEGGLLRA